MTISLNGTELHPIGLGCMPMSLSGRPPEERSIATIHAALDAGANLLDTADAYCKDESEIGHNERLIAKALNGRDREGLVVATKGGHIRPGGSWEIDGSPEHLRAACEASLKALDTDTIDLYQLHRPDPQVPYAESVGALKELRDEGKVREVGLSNCTVEQLEEAEAIVPIASVQNQLSLSYTDPLEKREPLVCAEKGIAFLAWSPLGGIGNADEVSGSVDPVNEAAEAHGVSPHQVALAWLRSLAPSVVPIPGASRPETATDSLSAAALELSEEEAEAITVVARRS